MRSDSMTDGSAAARATPRTPPATAAYLADSENRAVIGVGA